MFQHQKYFFIGLLIYFERAGEEQKEKEKERIGTVSGEPNVELKLMKCEIITWAKIKSQMLNQLSHPGTTPHPLAQIHLLKGQVFILIDPANEDKTIKEMFTEC